MVNRLLEICRDSSDEGRLDNEVSWLLATARVLSELQPLTSIDEIALEVKSSDVSEVLLFIYTVARLDLLRMLTLVSWL